MSNSDETKDLCLCWEWGAISDLVVTMMNNDYNLNLTSSRVKDSRYDLAI